VEASINTNITKEKLSHIHSCKSIALIIMNVSSLLFAISTYLRYYTYFYVQRIQHRYLHIDRFYSSWFFVQMLLEVFLAAFQPYPFFTGNFLIMIGKYWISNRSYWLVNYRYEVNDLLLLPVFCRFYIIYRFFISLSGYYGHRSDRIR
jgi:hypothetical protein